MDFIKLLQKGEVIGFPTDTVYGIGAAFSQISGIQKIYAIKGRPETKPLIAHVSSFEMAEALFESPSKRFYELAKEHWPGPVTLIDKKASHVSDLITANLPTIGVRIPNCQQTQDLIEKLGEPLIGTSANYSGGDPLFSHIEAEKLFGNKLAGYLEGSASLKVPSTVYSLFDGQILRRGSTQLTAKISTDL
ncbi:MAG: L-threonylcarbamoyladenylate synthase [Candidatus Algichlamydia australiensis]|nr:L-threonylcarbamoyladenylate synthase [Chlamydiales bacterium]